MPRLLKAPHRVGVGYICESSEVLPSFNMLRGVGVDGAIHSMEMTTGQMAEKMETLIHNRAERRLMTESGLVDLEYDYSEARDEEL